MRTNCLPNLITLSLHPINSCVAGKHALSVVEPKEKITSQDHAHSAKEAGVHGTLHAAAIDQGQVMYSHVGILVQASNPVMLQEHPPEKDGANPAAGSPPPPHPQHNDKGKVLLQALEGANQALATGAVASNQEHLFMKVKRHMTRKAQAQTKCGEGTDGGPAAFDKQSLSSHREPSTAAIEAPKTNRVFALAVCGDLLYTASQSKDIRAFRAPMFEELDCFGGKTEAVQSLIAFEDFLYSSHQDNKIRVWRRPKGEAGSRCKHKLVAVLPKMEHCVKSMLSKRNYVQVRRHKRKLWIEHADRISALALGGSTSKTGRSITVQGRCAPSVLYSASWDKTVKVWSLDNFKCMESFYAHHDAINAMLVIEGGILVTASADCTIKLWTKLSYPARKKRHGLLCTLEGHKAAVNALAISADGKVLYSGGADGTLLAWKKMYSGKAQGTRNGSGTIKGALSGTLSEESFTQINGKGKISRDASLAKQGSLGSCAVISRNVSGEDFVESSGSAELTMIGRGNSLTSGHGLSSLKKVIHYHNRLNALNAGTVSFVMMKKLIAHTRSVLSVSTVADNVVCSSSADKTIRVWLRAREKSKRWEYACVAVLAGQGGPVKAIAASVMSSATSTTAQVSTCSSSSRSMLHATPAPSSRYPLVEEIDEQGVIVYSGGLHSKAWVLKIPR